MTRRLQLTRLARTRSYRRRRDSPRTSKARFSGKPNVNARLSIMIVTDAWRPQVNGVARTMEMLDAELRTLGVCTHFLAPDGYRQIPMPGYPEIRFALASPWSVARAIEQARPDAVHIATEGPLGILARIHCRRTGRLFTTCFHTRYPEYIAARTKAPLAWTYAALRRFHNRA